MALLVVVVGIEAAARLLFSILAQAVALSELSLRLPAHDDLV